MDPISFPKQIIPFGNNCAVAYQMQKLGIRTSSLPFDWLIMSDFKKAVDCIVDNFEQFLKEDNLEVIRCNNKFPHLDEDWKDVENCSESIIVKNKECRITFCHDFDRDITKEIDSIKKKYQRRIQRLYDYLKQPCIFVHLGGLKREEIRYFNRFLFPHTLYIIQEKNVDGGWQRNDIDWQKIFSGLQ